MNFTNLIIQPIFVSVIFSFLATPLVIRFANKIGIIDDPKKHKHPKVIHSYPVPRGGGLAIFISLFISSLILIPLDKHLMGVLIGAIVITTLGLMDDIYDLSPYKRLIVQILAASIPIAFGIGIAYITVPFVGKIDLSHPQLNFELLGQTRSIWVLSDLFALFWIVVLMNFLNMGAKGVDGQLPGVVIIAALTISSLSLKFSADITQWPVIVLGMIVAGAFLGFLPWNFFPQKIMPAFSGSNLAGYMLGILSILATAKVGTLMLVLGVPLIDTGYTMIRRVMSGKSPVWGDRGHLHHKLLDAGISKRGVAMLYWAATALLGILALNLNAQYKFYTIVGVVIFIGGLLLWLTYKPKLRNTEK
jgi:UDP-GlcNAc:undecaprenyl-phosphate/decaprenyl-phosphate GlcNAc-1-phosphate transferase